MHNMSSKLASWFFFLLSLLVISTRAEWQLEWGDEFDQDKLDPGKWEVDHQDDKDKCDSKYLGAKYLTLFVVNKEQKIGRWNCYTNSSRNVRLINGTLALTAIYEQRLNKIFTSAWLKTGRDFTYGRFDIRAALPIGKMLGPWFKLVPLKNKNYDGTVRGRQVIVFHNDQSIYVKYGASLPKSVAVNVEDHLSDDDLNRFHTYTIIWNKTDLIWMFDNEVTNRVDLTNTSTFLNKPVILYFYLRVGGWPFNNQKISVDEVRAWNCSMFIIDYIRYYRWNDNGQDNTAAMNRNEHDRSAVDFCNGVMNDIRPEKQVQMQEQMKPANGGVNLVVLISILCLVMLLVLVSLVMWLVMRTRKMRDPARTSAPDQEYYDDVDHGNFYDTYHEMKDTKYEDYNDLYEDTHRQSNLYSQPETPPVNLTKVTNTAEEPGYLTMAASTKGSYVELHKY